MTTAPEPPLNGPSNASPAVVGTRPFGAHLSLRWWVPVVLTIVVIAAIYGLQLIMGGIAALVEFGLLGKDPDDASLTPLTFVAINLSTILVAPLALLVLAKAGRVPWRSALSVGRAFRWRRLGVYAGLFAVLMVLANAAVQLIHPSPLSLFAVSCRLRRRKSPSAASSPPPTRPGSVPPVRRSSSESPVRLCSSPSSTPAWIRG